MFSVMDELPEKLREYLEASWAGTFYREVFVRIDEKIFAPLYSDQPSRPNIPINVQVGLEMLKSHFNWSDEEMMENYYFNIQVRYALGYRNLGTGYFVLRTIYNFRDRLSQHMQETGENLFDKVFVQITDEQIEAFAVKTNQQRMDSTQIASNIRHSSRLRLLIEVLQRVHRCLPEAEQARWSEEFAPYVKEKAGQCVHRVKGKGAYDKHLQAIGELMMHLVEELAASYAEQPMYQMLVRVFGEHFVLEEKTLRTKKGKELSADSLQSPDDWEATYRQKRGEDYTGYVVNVSETCHEDNDVQLIVKVQTEPNTTDDAQMLADALPDLKARTDLEEMNTDGGYNSEQVDQLMREHQVDLVQTAIRGQKPAKDSFNLADCQLEIDPDSGQPLSITAPNGQRTEVESGRKPGRFIARFEQTAKPDQDPKQSTADPSDIELSSDKSPPPVLYFTQHQVDVALRRQRCAQLRASGKNPRAAVEATVGAMKHPFGDDQLPVRGKFRVSVMMIAAAATVNVWRIWRYQAKSGAANASKNGQNDADRSSLFHFVLCWIQILFAQACPTRHYALA
jgi:hypothetical protein